MGREYDFLKVLDFGVVKRTVSDEDTVLTGKGVISGTPAYMAPEFVHRRFYGYVGGVEKGSKRGQIL